MGLIFTLIRNINFSTLSFHLLFLFVISLQLTVSSPYINFAYILGLIIFMKSDKEYSLSTILLIFIYGFYQDLLLSSSFGSSSIIFIYFLFLGQLSNIFIGKGGSLFQGYLYLGGLIFYALFDYIYIFINFNILLKIDIFIINIFTALLFYFIFVQSIHFFINTNAR